MKRLMILSVLGLFCNISQASEASSSSQPFVFDENFGYTNTVFESGYHAGKAFKDMKAEAINPTVLDQRHTSTNAAIFDSKHEAQCYIYSYKINPGSTVSQAYRRYHSIEVSREILKNAGYKIPEPSSAEQYYIVTGKPLPADLDRAAMYYEALKKEHTLPAGLSFEEIYSLICNGKKWSDDYENIEQHDKQLINGFYTIWLRNTYKFILNFFKEESKKEKESKKKNRDI